MTKPQPRVFLLDYGAGNVRSVINAVSKLGFKLEEIKSQEDFALADKIIFPGVGSFGAAMEKLHSLGFVEPLKEYVRANRPFMGICVGMQCLYNSSQESPLSPGLGLIPGQVAKFNNATKAVPHIGWNGATPIPSPTATATKTSLEAGPSSSDLVSSKDCYYFVHSFAVALNKDAQGLEEHAQDWCHTLTTYGDETFVSSVSRGNVFATQFHPEKSGQAGLNVLRNFLESPPTLPIIPRLSPTPLVFPLDLLTKRIIACLDVRSNDQGDLVVTKGDQYDVREQGNGEVRNLGKPVELAHRYYQEGADEITFLNITSFRDCPLEDTPMLQVLKSASESVFVPLTIGGGIRDMKQPDGTLISALQVAGEYFRSGADKVSIGSDAVYIAEEYIKNGKKSYSENAISSIAHVYGAQAVVISVDPKRVYVASPSDTIHTTTKTTKLGPKGEEYCWYQCTVKGGREARDLDVVQLTASCEALGAGEILLNCMDHDGMNQGYDLELITMVKNAVKIPVIASSGAGKVEHFAEVFKVCKVEAALAAGIFHRKEVAIDTVKSFLHDKYLIRL